MLIMSAGPATVGADKLAALAEPVTNTMLDPNYITFHKQTERMISQLVGTESDSFVMLGEALLGLEAACASLIEPGDRVLVIHNGFFGEGFRHFVELYGGKPVMLGMDVRRGVSADALAQFLEKDHQFKAATLVHCETPSGITNPISQLCPLLAKHGILSIVDSVSAVGGEPIEVDAWQVDVLLGGSQKCLSLPAGLSLITLSQKAKRAIEERKTAIPSFYANFKNHYDHLQQKSFAYTMNDGLMKGLHLALQKALRTDYLAEHARYANLVRKTFITSGYELYAKDCQSNTVTAILLPEKLSAGQIFQKMYERGYLISKGVGQLTDRLIRIGHMGDNNQLEYYSKTFVALDQVMAELGHQPIKRLAESWEEQLD